MARRRDDLDVEHPFRADVEYVAGRADGIATFNGISVDEGRRELAQRHGFERWEDLLGRLAALRDGSEPATPFMLAYQAVGAEPNERGTFGGPQHGERVTALHLAAQDGHLDTVRVLLEAGADASARDGVYETTPADWADYCGHPRVGAVLREA